ncbi:MAG: fibronectin type III domain-containing protein [Niabella sp.]
MKSSLTFALLFFSLLLACKKNDPGVVPMPTIPKGVTTAAISQITNNSAISGGNVADSGGAAITAKGIVWSTYSNPAITLATKTNDGSGIGAFTSTITGLQPNTTYYIRAYATNSVGTAYGDEKSFTTTSVALPGNVYVAVQLQSSTNRALLWKDAVTSFLSDGSKHAFAKSIYVNETGVYVAGNEHNASAVYVAKYWKNGNAIDLSTGQKHAFADGIFVVGNTVYTAGSEETAAQRRAKYWVNGTEHNLTDGSKYAVGNAIFFANNNVYVAGNMNEPLETARVWVNGLDNVLTLTQNCIRSVAKSIWVNGNDVYVAGHQQFNTASGGKYVATVWKNGTPALLTPASNNGYATAVTVKNANVYVTGYENINGINIAKVWKNQVAVNLSNGNIDEHTSSIFVTDTEDVYVGGYSGNINTGIQAKYWKNGQAFTNNNGTYAWGIFVY